MNVSIRRVKAMEKSTAVRRTGRPARLRAAGVLVLMGLILPLILVACGGGGEGTPTAAPVEKLGGELKILQWSHFVPRYDEWFDAFAKDWGARNGVKVTVDHIGLAEIRSRAAAEIAAGQGHDMIEFIDPPADFEPSMLDLTDLNQEIERRHGKQVAVATRSSFNPTTKKFYGLTHGWTPDPGDYRKSLWEKVGLPNGPSSYQELLEGGRRIKSELGIQMGIGMSNEIDSNMAARALLWSFGASIQDEKENVVINSPQTVEAVKYMVQLFKDTMTNEVFSWNAASNNQLLIAGKASYILNSISAYRTAQKVDPKIADDIFFTPALKGPKGIGFASEHVIMTYTIPKFSKNPDAAKAFLRHLVANYDRAVFESELYVFPSWLSTAPDLLRPGGWLDDDPFRSNPRNKLAVLKNAVEWTTNVGHPGPANAAEGEVFATFILPNMMARAARGEITAEEAVKSAEGQILPIFKKWREKGLIGGQR
jgi:multiple sugar transport system substrate-binding protein